MAQDVNDTVSIIQRYIGADADGLWGSQTSARFTEAMRVLQAELGIESDGWMGPQTAAAFEQAIAEGKISREFGEAVIALYNGETVDQNGQPVRLDDLHSKRGHDMHSAPLVQDPQTGAYSVEGGADKFDLRAMMPTPAPAPEPEPEAEVEPAPAAAPASLVSKFAPVVGMAAVAALPFTSADMTADTAPAVTIPDTAAAPALASNVNTITAPQAPDVAPLVYADSFNINNPFMMTLRQGDAASIDTVRQQAETISALMALRAEGNGDGRLTLAEAALTLHHYRDEDFMRDLNDAEKSKISVLETQMGVEPDHNFAANDRRLLEALAAYSNDNVYGAIPAEWQVAFAQVSAPDIAPVAIDPAQPPLNPQAVIGAAQLELINLYLPPADENGVKPARTDPFFGIAKTVELVDQLPEILAGGDLPGALNEAHALVTDGIDYAGQQTGDENNMARIKEALTGILHDIRIIAAQHGINLIATEPLPAAKPMAAAATEERRDPVIAGPGMG